MKETVLKKDTIPKLIAMSQKGDFSAVENLIRLVQKDIYTSFSHLTCNKEDIADLTQETLLKMVRSIGQLKDVGNFKAWLNRIVVNTFYDYLRKNPQNILQSNEENINKIKDKNSREPSQKFLCSETEKVIKNAILSLPDELKITIILREIEGLSYSDISKATNSTLGTVKSRIARARFRLQEQLQEYI